MDRIVLIELLALALLINAAAILLVLRARWMPAHATATAIASASPPEGDLPPVPQAPRVAVAADTLSSGPVDLVGVARQSALALEADPAGRWSGSDDEAWAGRVRAESSRCRRYGRPAAVVAFRLDGLDALCAEAGPPVAAWLSGAVLRSVRSGARESDLVQSDGHAAIRVLLVETDEDGARIYVERVSRPLTLVLQDPNGEVRLSAGWAGTSSESDLQTTDRLARARLDGTSAGWIRSIAAWPS